MKYSTFFRDSTHILLTRDFISMMKEVPLYHQMNGGIHMNQLVTGKFISAQIFLETRHCWRCVATTKGA